MFYHTWLRLCISSLLVSAVLTGSALASSTPSSTFQVAQRTYTTAPYASVLKKHVNSQGQVNYTVLKNRNGDLVRYLQILARLPRSTYESWSNSKKIAFWINAYNALTLDAIIKAYPVKSIKDISGVWNWKKHQVMGKSMTLDDIEHQVLRKQFSEPRIHMALVCASKGCPPLLNTPFTGARLNAQLKNRTAAFARDRSKFRVDKANKTVYLSSIFKWYGQDFIKQFGTRQFQGSAKERASLNYLSSFSSDKGFLQSGKYQVRYLPYDWSLNKQ